MRKAPGAAGHGKGSIVRGRPRLSYRSVGGRPILAVILLAFITTAVMTSAPPLAADPAPAAHGVVPVLTLTAIPDTITAGRMTTLAAQTDVLGAVLTVSRGTVGAPVYAVERTVVADAAGAVSWTVSPRRTRMYRVELAGDATRDAAFAEITVSVRPRLTLTATSPVYQGRKVVFAAKVVPAHPGATVDVQRLVDGVWTQWRTVTLNDESRRVFRWISDRRGSNAFRLTMPADADHVDGTSARRVVRVKDPNPYDVSRREAHFIVVDRSQYKLYYHEFGRIVRVFDCVLGKTSTPTPLGHFKIYAKDPNVSGPYGPRRMRYLGAYAIHGTNEPWLLTRFPRAYSHGCTRLANTNILWLYARAHVGTRVWNVP